MIRRLVAGFTIAVGVLVLSPPSSASAHPLGNFTVNQHAGLVVQREAVSIEFVVDMAEIPAFQTRKEIDADGDDAITPEENRSFRDQTCERLGDGMTVRLDGERVPTILASSALTFPPGQAGLETLRLTCQLRALAHRELAGRRVDFENRNYGDRVGWREVIAAGDEAKLARSDVPRRSPSRRLTRYPDDLLSAPLDVRRAHLQIGTGPPSGRAASGVDPAAAAGPLPRGADRITSAFTGLVARQDFTAWFALIALAAAVALGALHALAPGHGKTVMAAYLVGERGSLRQAVLLGLTVTATHTTGVLILGVLLSGSARFVPEQIYPWLGLTSGALLATVGGSLLLRAWRCRRHGMPSQLTHDHHHRHGSGQSHTHRPGHSPSAPHADVEAGISRRTLMAMGAAGGMVPSPSALVVLMGAIALGRTWFGIALVLSYGIGMALTLIAAGLLLVRARSTLDSRLVRAGGRSLALARALPLATASLVVVAGIGLTARAISQI